VRIPSSTGILKVGSNQGGNAKDFESGGHLYVTSDEVLEFWCSGAHVVDMNIPT